MKTVFMGTPDFAVPALEALIASGRQIVAVYTQPPRPSGRGQKEKKSPVHLIAEKHGLLIKTPKSLKNESAQAEFVDLAPEIAVVAAYGLILPSAVINACPCFNIHASLLPRWRGAAPIQRAILAGDEESGVTIMKMDEGLDTGDMLIWDSVKITDKMTAGELHDALGEMGARLIVEAIHKFQQGDLISVKQVGESTYASKITKEEARLNWSENITLVDRKIRAFNPFPGAYFVYNNEKIKILFADFVEKNHDFQAGYITDNSLGIACFQGILHPAIVQRQGKKAMPVENMLRGLKIPVGTILS